MTQAELSVASGVALSTIKSIETGRVKAPQPDTLASLALGLHMTIPELMAQIYGSPTPRPTGAIPVIRVPVLGVVKAGTFVLSQEQNLGFIIVDKQSLSGVNAKLIDDVYALLVSGNSLAGDKIYEGYHLIVDPNQRDIIDNQIYVLRNKDQECAVRHVIKENDHLILYSTGEPPKVTTATDIEILGRVVSKYFMEST